MTYKFTWQLLCLFAIPFVFSACGEDDDAPELFIDRLEATYIGDYEQRSCTLPQSVVFSVEDNATAEIRKQSEEDIEVILGNATLGTFIEFQAVVDSDSSFTVPEFMAEDGKSYTGRGVIINDLLRINLNDGCTALGAALPIVVFQEL